MKILIEVFDKHSQVKHEAILDIRADDLPTQLTDILTLAVKKDCNKIVIFLHEVKP